MKQTNYLDPNKLERLSQQIYDTACAHGWHEEHFSNEHWLCLIMTEMAEAVEADRKGRRANMEAFRKFSMEGEKDTHKEWYMSLYQNYIKGSLEEEFADIVIRLIDMAVTIHGKNMKWFGYYPFGATFNENMTFSESAWKFIREVLNWGMINISDSVSYIYDWAAHFVIDLDQHIELKMKYNQLRPYKHGGKKY